MNYPGERELECNKGANQMSGLVQGGIKIMAIPYKKGKAMCSPTSALLNERMLSEGLRNILPGRGTAQLIVEMTLGSLIMM